MWWCMWYLSLTAIVGGVLIGCMYGGVIILNTRSFYPAGSVNPDMKDEYLRLVCAILQKN